MLLIRNISDIPETDRPVVLAMGCFDGVHIGHQSVISAAVEQARRCGGEAWVFTFHPHPAKILSPETAPPLISDPPGRLRRFEQLGVHGVIEIPFDRSYAHTEPDVFLSGLWTRLPTLAGIVCGTDWSFGYQARGKVPALKKLCMEHGIAATVVPPVLYDEEKISSTRIRQAVHAGDMPLAEAMLGRPFSLSGTVVPGRGVGRRLGFPTANIHPENELLPAPGVYAAHTRLQTAEGRSQASGVRGQQAGSSSLIPDPCSLTPEYPSAVFIGERKTFSDPEPVIETYLLDFDGELYGQSVEIVLHQKIRDIEKFPSRDALVAQIKKDVAQIGATLESAAG